MNDADDAHYTCGMCGTAHLGHADYITHLIEKHGDTWLARRVARETEIRESQKKHGTSK